LQSQTERPFFCPPSFCHGRSPIVVITAQSDEAGRKSFIDAGSGRQAAARLGFSDARWQRTEAALSAC